MYCLQCEYSKNLSLPWLWSKWLDLETALTLIAAPSHNHKVSVNADLQFFGLTTSCRIPPTLIKADSGSKMVIKAKSLHWPRGRVCVVILNNRNSMSNFCQSRWRSSCSEAVRPWWFCSAAGERKAFGRLERWSKFVKAQSNPISEEQSDKRAESLAQKHRYFLDHEHCKFRGSYAWSCQCSHPWSKTSKSRFPKSWYE